MTTLLSRTRTAPLTASLAIGLLLPVVVLAGPINNGKRPATQTNSAGEVLDVALPAAGPCRATDDSDSTVAGVDSVADSSAATHPGIEVGSAEDDGREIVIEDAGELELSDAEAAVYLAAAAEFVRNGAVGNCDESDLDVSTAE